MLVPEEESTVKEIKHEFQGTQIFLPTRCCTQPTYIGNSNSSVCSPFDKGMNLSSPATTNSNLTTTTTTVKSSVRKILKQLVFFVVVVVVVVVVIISLDIARAGDREQSAHTHPCSERKRGKAFLKHLEHIVAHFPNVYLMMMVIFREAAWSKGKKMRSKTRSPPYSWWRERQFGARIPSFLQAAAGPCSHGKVALYAIISGARREPTTDRPTRPNGLLLLLPLQPSSIFPEPYYRSALVPTSNTNNEPHGK